MKAVLPHFVHTMVQGDILSEHRNVQESRETALAADAKPVVRQRALTTLHVRQQADDFEGMLATSFAIQPLVRRQHLLQRHPIAIITRPLLHDLQKNVRMPPQYGHKVKGLPAK